MNEKSISWYNRFRRTPAFTGCVLFLSVLLINIVIQTPAKFLTLRNFNTLFSKNTPLILVTMAQSLLLITGTLDFSVGVQVALVNVVTVMTTQEWGIPLYVGFVFGILASFVASAVCGAFVSLLRLPTIIASFSMIYIIKGVNVLIMNTPQGRIPRAYYGTYDSLLFGFIPFSLLFILLVFMIWFYVKNSRIGLHMYAVGCNPQNAYAAGINPAGIQMKAFLLKGFIVGLAGIALTLMSASGNPLQAEDYGIRSLSACIIGGLGFGGWGTMGCGFLGAGFLVLIQNAVYYFFTLLVKLIPGFSVNSYWQSMTSDMIIFLGLLMTIVTAKGQREALRQGIVRQFIRGEKYVK